MKTIFFLFFLTTFTLHGQNTPIKLLSQFRSQGKIRTFNVDNNKLYIIAGDYLEIYDLTTNNFQKLGEFYFSSDYNSRVTQISIKGNYLFANKRYDGIKVLDVTNPNSIKTINSYKPSLTNTAQGFSILNNTIFCRQVEGYSFSSVLFSILEDSKNFREQGTYNLPFYSETFELKARQNTLYIVATKYWENSYQGADLLAVDYSDINDPIEYYREHSGFRRLDIQDDYLFTIDTSNTLKIFDIANSSTPTLVNELETNKYASFSVDSNQLVIFNSLEGYSLFNTSSISNIVMDDILKKDYSFHYHILNSNKLIISNDYELEAYDISDYKFKFDKRMRFTEEFVFYDINVDNNIAYIVGNNGLYNINISDKQNPYLISFTSYKENYSPTDPVLYTRLIKQNNYLYLVGYKGLQIIDVSDPQSPIKLGAISNEKIKDIFVKNNIAYISTQNLSNYSNYFRIIDITDKLKPVELNFIGLEGSGPIFVDSCYAYISTESYFDNPTTNLNIYDISNINSISKISSTKFNFGSHGLFISNNLAYIASSSGLKIIDLNNKLNPQILSSYGNFNCKDLDYNNGIINLAAENKGLVIIDVQNNKSPQLISEYKIGGATNTTTSIDGNIFITAGQAGMHIMKLDIAFGEDKNFDVSSNDFQLKQNYPNPFNSTTTIPVYLPGYSKVEINIYNILGAKITQLNDYYGLHGWHYINYLPINLASGVYLLNVKSSFGSQTKKINFIK